MDRVKARGLGKGILTLVVLALECSGCILFYGPKEKRSPEDVTFTDTDEKYMATRVANVFVYNMGEVPLKRDEKVWVVGLENKSSRNLDKPILSTAIDDALIDALLREKKCQVVEKDADMVRNIYIEQQESAQLEFKDSKLGQEAKIANADVILAYRIIKLERWKYNPVVKLFSNDSHDLGKFRIALHLRLIDTRTGMVRWSGYFEEPRKNPLNYKKPERF
ncbi:MAG: hypothetical protein GXP25_22590 [Planctomycetes bacterium]|nr:hypothetical protein [Planctomycetota bacterium]